MANIETTWTPAKDALKNALSEFPIPIFDSKEKKDSKDPYSKYVLTDEEKTRYSALAVEYAKANGFTEITQENINSTNAFIYQRIVADNFSKFIQIAVDKAASDAIAKWQVERDNPPQKNNVKTLDKGAKTLREQAEAIAAKWGGRYAGNGKIIE